MQTYLDANLKSSQFHIDNSFCKDTSNPEVGSLMLASKDFNAMVGDRFFCVLTNDSLQLFNSKEEADKYYG